MAADTALAVALAALGCSAAALVYLRRCQETLRGLRRRLDTENRTAELERELLDGAALDQLPPRARALVLFLREIRRDR